LYNITLAYAFEAQLISRLLDTFTFRGRKWKKKTNRRRLYPRSEQLLVFLCIAHLPSSSNSSIQRARGCSGLHGGKLVLFGDNYLEYEVNSEILIFNVVDEDDAEIWMTTTMELRYYLFQPEADNLL